MKFLLISKFQDKLNLKMGCGENAKLTSYISYLFIHLVILFSWHSFNRYSDTDGFKPISQILHRLQCISGSSLHSLFSCNRLESQPLTFSLSCFNRLYTCYQSVSLRRIQRSNSLFYLKCLCNHLVNWWVLQNCWKMGIKTTYYPKPNSGKLHLGHVLFQFSPHENIKSDYPMSLYL